MTARGQILGALGQVRRDRRRLPVTWQVDSDYVALGLQQWKHGVPGCS